MSYEIDTFTSGDYRVRVVQDDDCESPRGDYNLGTMITWDRNYHSPDRNEFDSPEKFYRWWFGNEDCDDVYSDVRDPEKDPRCIRLPVYKYEHSGVAYSTDLFGDRWDSGQVGWIFTTPESVEETGAPIESLAEQLKNEVKYYSLWASGQCYGYIVEKRNECDHCGNEEWEEISSCYGFIGKVFIDLPTGCPDELRDYLKSEGHEVY